jgi:hypothetical protein
MPNHKAIFFKNIDAKNQEVLFNLASSCLIDYELACLKLEILKENFEYREFYHYFKNAPELFLSMSQIPECDNPPKRSPTPLFTPATTQLKSTDLQYHFERFNLNHNVQIILWYLNWPLSELVALFDPANELDSVGNDDLKAALPLFFSPPGIKHYMPGQVHRFFYDPPKPFSDKISQWTRLEPYQHLFVVDLRKAKEQLKLEFAKLLNLERLRHSLYFQKQPIYEFDETYTKWEPDGRERLEAKQQLQVWKLRRLRNGFKQIAEKLELSEDTAKKNFYRAYELIQGKKYEPEKLKREVWEHKIKDLKRTCESCPDRLRCRELCPDAMAYAEQDYVGLQETNNEFEIEDKEEDYIE